MPSSLKSTPTSMPETQDKPSNLLEQEPAVVLARELARAHELDDATESPAVQLASRAYAAALRGSTCEKVEKALMKGIDDNFCAKDSEIGVQPLVIRDGNLYLSQLDRLEEELAELFRERLASLSVTWEPDAAWLPQPKPGRIQTCGDQQKAVRMACERSFMILTGGPGTGKTTTAACIVGAAISHLKLPLSSVRMCAPTGRATNRLDMGIRGGDQENVLTANAHLLGIESAEAFKSRLPKALTVHKLVHKPELLANTQLVIVDECSNP